MMCCCPSQVSSRGGGDRDSAIPTSCSSGYVRDWRGPGTHRGCARIGDWLVSAAAIASGACCAADAGGRFPRVVMSSTGVVAIFIPVVLRIANKSRIEPISWTDAGRRHGGDHAPYESSSSARRSRSGSRWPVRADVGRATRGQAALEPTICPTGPEGWRYLLLAGPWKAIRRLQSGGRDLVVLNLPKEFDEFLPAASGHPMRLHPWGCRYPDGTGIVPNVQAA